jgi:hypothetical protein
MDDLPQLLRMLKTTPPPLSQEEQQQIEMIQKALFDPARAAQQQKSVVPPEFHPISQPPPFPPMVGDSTPTRTIYETEDAAGRVGDLGNFRTIAEGLANYQPGSTLYILDGNYRDEQLEILKPVHLVGEGNVKLTDCRFYITGNEFTMRGFALETSTNEIFTLNGGGTFGLQNCRLDSRTNAKIPGAKTPFDVKVSTSIEINGCQITSERVMNAKNGVTLDVLNSAIIGPISFTKSDANFRACRLDGRVGAAIEGLESQIIIVNCELTGSKDVALSARDRSKLRIRDSSFNKVRGAGILVHGFAQLTAENLRISACSKAGIIVSSSAAVVTGTSIVSNLYTGCEVLQAGTLELNETWIGDCQGPGVLCESKGEVKLVRSRITKGQSHGIEATNGSLVTMIDTLVEQCYLTGVFLNASKVTAQSSEFSANQGVNMFADNRSWIEATNCTYRTSKTNGLEADNETMIVCNGCYFVNNGAYGVSIRTCRDIKFLESVFASNTHGGALFESIKANEAGVGGRVIIDECTIDKNSFVLSTVDNAVVRRSRFMQATTKHEQQPREHFEIRHKTNAIFEDTHITKSCTRVKNSTVAIGNSHFSSSPNFAIIAEYYADLTVEGNDFNKDKMILNLKDNSSLHLFNNKMTNIMRPQLKEPLAKTSVVDQKVKTISVRSFSKATIEGNLINGDYDYAIYVDGQSNVDCRANQIQCGQQGGICYSGVSSGFCEENTYTGKDQSHAEFFAHGCIQKRKGGI